MEPPHHDPSSGEPAHRPRPRSSPSSGCQRRPVGFAQGAAEFLQTQQELGSTGDPLVDLRPQLHLAGRGADAGTGTGTGDDDDGTDGDGTDLEYTLDAVEFGRILSGRATGTGLLAQRVPF